jgi:membrane-associated phospholipid phosphatase
VTGPRRGQGFGRYRDTRYRWVDIVTMSYMAATGMLNVLLGSGQPGWISAVLLHLTYVIVGLEVVRLQQRHPASGILLQLRTWYPGFIIIYGFFDVARLQHLISSGTFWASDAMADLDLALFGVHPTIWIQKFHTPWLNDVICFFNVSYYLLPLLFAVPLLVQGKRAALWAGASIALTTYVVNYSLFILLPAVGPRMMPAIEALRDPALEGGPFVWLQLMVQGDHGTVRGNAFPSAHVSGAVAWTLVAWRYERRVFLPLLILTLGTAVSTVYLGFHHAIDPLAGFLVGGGCYWLGLRIIRARGEDPISDPEAALRGGASRT